MTRGQYTSPSIQCPTCRSTVIQRPIRLVYYVLRGAVDTFNLIPPGQILLDPVLNRGLV